MADFKLFTSSVAVQADLDIILYIMMIYGSHLNFSERCSNNIIEQALSCLHNLVGVGGFVAEVFSQTILPSNMLWSTVVFSGLLETCQGSAEPYTCWGMT